MTRDLNFLDRLEFVFAKTMADTPHEYVVRTPENEEAYVALWWAIKGYGVYETWERNGRRYKYLYRGGWKYWYMGSLAQSRVINRVKV